MIGILLAASLSASLDGSPPQKTVDPATADLRCFAASLALVGANKGNDEIETAGAMVAFYYLGRLEGRDPGEDWISRSIELGNAEGAGLLAELDRCGAEFEAKGKEMQAKGSASGG